MIMDMFKLSLITDEVSQDFRQAVQLAAKYQLDAVEIRSVYERGPFEFTPEDIKQIKAIADDAGLGICSISSPFYKCSLDNPGEKKAHLESLKKCVDYAGILGCKIIRGFTFWAEDPFEKRFSDICAEFEEPAKLLENTGVTLALEFDPSTYATNGKKVARIVDAVNSPCIKILWDPGNDIWDPDCETPYPEGYSLVKNNIAHIHLKDAVKSSGTAEGVAMCTGEVDYEGQFKALINDRYSGYMSLETHYRPKTGLSEELLKMPKGSDFSAFGYESSEECLINIKNLLKRLK